MRIGLIGTGRIGTFHAETLLGLPAVTGLVLHDADGHRARAVADKLGVDAVPDLTALLASRPDGVVIAAPTATHAALVRACAGAGIPVFCEKPIAATLADTRTLLAELTTAQVPLQVGFQRRFDTGYAALRRSVADGALGWVHTVRAVTSDPQPPPAGYVAVSGGIFRDCAVHDFDMVRWVTGREVVEVYATGSDRGDACFAAAGDVGTAVSLLTLDDGTLASCTATRHNGAGYDVRMEVSGSRGTLAAGLTARTPVVGTDGDPWPVERPHEGFLTRFRDAYTAELTAFTELVAGAGPSPCTGEDALAALLIAEAAEESRRSGRPVRVTEVLR
ncbi:Gfo/Idh/MocA family oxidoreductase [Streptomyces sp. AM 4-1-1]|uniref:Gfo/Idh/MocA family protein n=1 Tax=Streptomyces sp. AM 4-1-1 TaxID=3028710 RepID=UPI0023BA00DC|nr:Gfo/Idh/MocA family oxidoreductase [Streptomyces sp. AM 4-1-1]WEH36917.1 Gfo/Idh/MocA family oxidoreductase [Streptomyces sp. AM 4-1-1]